jgi:hypothetical protein
MVVAYFLMTLCNLHVIMEEVGLVKIRVFPLGITIPGFLFLFLIPGRTSPHKGLSMTYQLSVCLQKFMPTLTIALSDLHSFKKLIKNIP